MFLLILNQVLCRCILILTVAAGIEQFRKLYKIILAKGKTLGVAEHKNSCLPPSLLVHFLLLLLPILHLFFLPLLPLFHFFQYG
jgi:hypothetical protein